MNSSYLSSPKVFFFQFCVAMSPCRHVATSVRQCLNLKIYKNLFLRSIATVPQYTVFIQSSGKYLSTKQRVLYKSTSLSITTGLVLVLRFFIHFLTFPHFLTFYLNIIWSGDHISFFLSFFFTRSSCCVLVRVRTKRVY